MTTRLEKDMESLKKDIEKFRSHLGTMLSDVGTFSHDKVLATKDRLKAATEGLEGRALEQIGHANEVIHERGQQAIDVSRDMVAKRPITTVAVSFAAGLMTALLLEKRKS